MPILNPGGATRCAPAGGATTSGGLPAERVAYGAGICSARISWCCSAGGVCAAVPRAARSMKNPVPLTDAVLAEGREHWADHCAPCHGLDGKGNTEIGRGLYPKVPDMSDGSRGVSDGELFYIIANGVRL